MLIFDDETNGLIVCPFQYRLCYCDRSPVFSYFTNFSHLFLLSGGVGSKILNPRKGITLTCLFLIFIYLQLIRRIFVNILVRNMNVFLLFLFSGLMFFRATNFCQASRLRVRIYPQSLRSPTRLHLHVDEDSIRRTMHHRRIRQSFRQLRC